MNVEDLRIPRDASPAPRRTGLWVALGLALAAGAGAALGIPPLLRHAHWSSEGSRPVRTAVLASRAAPGEFAAGGWIEPAPPAPIVVSARVAGTVIELTVLPGERVEEGAVLARLDARPLMLARAEVDARLRVATARLATLQAGPRREEVAAAAAALGEAEAVARRSRGAAERARALRESDAVSAADAERAEAEAAGTEAARAAAAARLDLVRAGPRPEELAEAQAEVDLARAALFRADADLAWADVLAPCGGVVLERYVRLGETVSLSVAHENRPPGAVLSLYDPAALQVRVDLPQSDAARVAVGREARVTLEADPGRTYPGRVARLDPLADLAKNTVRARVALLETGPALRPDLAARVAFSGGDGGTEAGVRVPLRCVVRGADGAAVYVVAGGRVRRTAVTLGPDPPPGVRDVPALSGLGGGETVVLDPPADLRDGEPVAAPVAGPVAGEGR